MKWERIDNTNDWSVSEMEIIWNIPEDQELGIYK